MTGSKPVALPLGDTPILLLLITYIGFICKLFLFYGALGEIRTHDLRLRRATLYPAELQAHCLFARLKHSYECTRLARLLGASHPLVPDGTVLADVVHLRSPNSRPSLIKGDTLSCLSYKHPIFCHSKDFHSFFIGKTSFFIHRFFRKCKFFYAAVLFNCLKSYTNNRLLNKSCAGKTSTGRKSGCGYVLAYKNPR